MKENGHTGGLFVVVLLSFFFFVLFWRLAIALLIPPVAFWGVIGLGRRLSQMNFKVAGAILFFMLMALTLGLFAMVTRDIFHIDFFDFVLPAAAITAMSYSLRALKSYLHLSSVHRVIYFVLPALFAVTVLIPFLFAQP